MAQYDKSQLDLYVDYRHLIIDTVGLIHETIIRIDLKGAPIKERKLLATALSNFAQFSKSINLNEKDLPLELNQLEKIIDSTASFITGSAAISEATYNDLSSKIKDLHAVFKDIGGNDRQTPDREIDIEIKNANIAKKIAELEERLKTLDVRLEAKHVEISRAMLQITEEHVTKQKNVIDGLEKDYQEAQINLELKLKNIERLEGLISSELLSEGHEKHAEAERRRADTFRSTAILLAATIIILLIYKSSEITPSEISLGWIISHFGGSVFATFLIGYLVRQSAVHRAQQHKHMQTALDLAALNPFLADVKEDFRHEVKKGIAEKIFVPKDYQTHSDGGDFGLQELGSKLIDKLDVIRLKKP